MSTPSVTFSNEHTSAYLGEEEPLLPKTGTLQERSIGIVAASGSARFRKGFHPDYGTFSGREESPFMIGQEVERHRAQEAAQAVEQERITTKSIDYLTTRRDKAQVYLTELLQRAESTRKPAKLIQLAQHALARWNQSLNAFRAAPVEAKKLAAKALEDEKAIQAIEECLQGMDKPTRKEKMYRYPFR